jgi:hypothetical protein
MGRQGDDKKGKRILKNIRIKEVRKRARCCRIKVNGGERRTVMTQLRQSIINAGRIVIMTRKSRDGDSVLSLSSLSFSAVKESESGFTKCVLRYDLQVS